MARGTDFAVRVITLDDGVEYAVAAGILVAGTLALISFKSSQETVGHVGRAHGELTERIEAILAQSRELSEIEMQLERLRDMTERLTTDLVATRADVVKNRGFLEEAEEHADEHHKTMERLQAGLDDERSSLDKLQRSVEEELTRTERRAELVDHRIDEHESVTAAQIGDVRSRLFHVAYSRRMRMPTRAYSKKQGAAIDQLPTERTTRALLVNSIPKSGTYLVAGLLTEIGLVDSGLHFRDDHYWDFWQQPLREVIGEPSQYLRRVPLEQSIRLLDQGQFAVAHLERPQPGLEVLRRSNVATVLLVRNVNNCLVSMMRFECDPRRWDSMPLWATNTNPAHRFAGFLRDRGERYLKGVRAQLGYMDTGVPVIRFEDLYGDAGSANQKAAIAVFTDAVRDITGLRITPSSARKVLRERVIGQTNRTFSGHRSSLDQFRSESVDRLLDELGVAELNHQLGY